MNSQEARRRRFEAAANQGWECFWCGESISKCTATTDHIFPRARGGSNRFHNIVASCQRCNGTKGDLDPVEFITGATAT